MMHLWYSQYREKEDNVKYPNTAEINTLEELKRAVSRDHIAPKMKDNYRSSGNFISADCIMLDLDNTHSDDPGDWKTLDDITDAFQDVGFYYIQSRNHMKEKTVTNKKTGVTTRREPREKYHLYFPLSKPCTDPKEYDRLLLRAAGLFPFFDMGAAKPAQFFFGVETPTGGQEPGSLTLDIYMDQVEDTEIVAAVKDFSSKYNMTDEARKAATRLYNVLGIKQQASIEEPLQAVSDAPTDPTSGYTGLGLEIAQAEQLQRLEWLQRWAEEHHIDLGKRYRINTREHPGAVCICVSCPWSDEHSMNGAENESVIIVELGGKLNYLCRHGHCYGRGWRDYRAYYEQQEQPATIDPSNVTLQPLNDPAGADQEQQPAEQPAGEQTQEAKPAAQPDELPCLLTFQKAVNIFETADDETIEIKSFPRFSKAARIKKHDSIAIAAETGGGKSSLAINILNDLNETYPCLYVNLEMDTLEILQRIVSIQSGMELDRIQGYRKDEQTARAVNVVLENITARKPLQVARGAYMLEELEKLIAVSTQGRQETTMVFVDHSLLLQTEKRTTGRYDRFTEISEGLRKIALKYNIVMFALLQQNRAGKANKEEPPQNDSLKESGAWENDATHIVFLWYDPVAKRKKLVFTKNRHGETGHFPLNYWKKTQRYMEADTGGAVDISNIDLPPTKKSNREKQKEKLQAAVEQATINTGGTPTLLAIAEAADVTTKTVKGWIKEYGGCTINGVQIDPAGMDLEIEYSGLVKLTPADSSPFDEDEEPAAKPATNGKAAEPDKLRKGRKR